MASTSTFVQTGGGAAISVGAAAAGSAAAAGTPVVIGGVALAGTTLAAATAGAGLVLAVAVMLISQHFARVKGAQTENQKLNLAIPGVADAIKMIFNSLNQGTMSPSQAIQALQTLQQQYWQSVASVETGPGQAGGPQTCQTHTEAQPAGSYSGYLYAEAVPLGGTWYSVTCDKHHTASTCVGCNNVNNWIAEAIAVVQRGGGTARFNKAFGSGYGFSGYGPWTAVYNPPPIPQSIESLAGSASTAIHGISSLFGGSSTQVPNSAILGSGSPGYSGPLGSGPLGTSPTTGEPGILASVGQGLQLSSLVPAIIIGLVVAVGVSFLRKKVPA